MPLFDTPGIYSCGKYCEKRKNCLLQAISPFLKMFSTLYDTYFSFYMHFKISSVIFFNSDQYKILSCGNGLILTVLNEYVLNVNNLEKKLKYCYFSYF